MIIMIMIMCSKINGMISNCCHDKVLTVGSIIIYLRMLSRSIIIIMTSMLCIRKDDDDNNNEKKIACLGQTDI